MSGYSRGQTERPLRTRCNSPDLFHSHPCLHLWLLAYSIVDGSFSVQPTAVLEAGALQKVAVIQRKSAVVTDLLHDGIRRFNKALVPVRVVADQGTNFGAAKNVVVVRVGVL